MNNTASNIGTEVARRRSLVREWTESQRLRTEHGYMMLYICNHSGVGTRLLFV